MSTQSFLKRESLKDRDNMSAEISGLHLAHDANKCKAWQFKLKMEAPAIHALWQPYLIGSRIRLRPLAEEDFDALFLAASDPLIWEQHPDRERYTPRRFQIYFTSGMESRGALAIIDLITGKLIGCSRFTDHDPEASFVKIGFTFLKREYWGDSTNRELKALMLDYAFQFVNTVYFIVGAENLRSRKAMTKLGAVETERAHATRIHPALDASVVYEIEKMNWEA